MTMTARMRQIDDFEPESAAGAAARQYITFACAGQTFGIDIMAMREIRNWSPVTPLPAQRPDVLGIIEIRGRVIPVHDLALRIGCSAERKTQHEGQVILILLVDGKDMGLLVDSVSDIVEIRNEDLLPVPQIEGSAAKFLAGIARNGDQLVAILDEIVVQSHAIDIGPGMMDGPTAAPLPAAGGVVDAELVFVDEL